MTTFCGQTSRVGKQQVTGGLYTYTIHDSIDDVDRDAWVSLNTGRDDVFMDPRFIKVAEGSMDQIGQLRCVLFRDLNGRAVASACFYPYVLEASHLFSDRAKRVVAFASRVLPWLTRFRLIVCGLPIGAGQSSLRIAADADAAAILAILDSILLEVAAEFRAIAILWREFTDRECERLQPLHDLGYRREAQFPMHHAAVVDSSFSEYCQRIKSSKRRVIKRSQEKFESSGMRVEHKTGAQTLSDVDSTDFYHLFEAVLDGKQTFEILPPKFFDELACRMPDQVVFTLISKDDQIKAFAASLRTESVFRQLFVGYDTESNADCDLYFNLWFHILDYALQGGFSDIVLGQTCDTFKKQKLGAWQDDRSYFTKGLNRFASTILRLTSAGMQKYTESA